MDINKEPVKSMSGETARSGVAYFRYIGSLKPIDMVSMARMQKSQPTYHQSNTHRTVGPPFQKVSYPLFDGSALINTSFPALHGRRAYEALQLKVWLSIDTCHTSVLFWLYVREEREASPSFELPPGGGGPGNGGPGGSGPTNGPGTGGPGSGGPGGTIVGIEAMAGDYVKLALPHRAYYPRFYTRPG